MEKLTGQAEEISRNFWSLEMYLIEGQVCKRCQFVLRLQYCQSCQSMDFPSLLCLHMPSAASAHAQ